MLNFSIFDVDDGTLGDINDARSVVVQGTTTVNRLFNSSAFPIEQWLRTALENKGFYVVSARYTWNSWFNDNSINYEVELLVFNRHSADEVRRNAIVAIEAYRANLGLNKVFSNTTASVSYDGIVIRPQGSGSLPTYPPALPPATNPTNPPSQYDTSQNAGNSKGNSKAWDDFWANLGFTVAPTVGVVVLVGGLGLIVLMRR